MNTRKKFRKGEISKDSYLLANFSKIKHKSWELYCITRILHLLDDDDIEYVCQQLVKKKSGDEFFFTDLCFPSLGIYVEINEDQHFSKSAKEDDRLREREIFDATNWVEIDIDVYNPITEEYLPLSQVKDRIDEVVNIIKARKSELVSDGSDITWDYKSKYDPQTYINKGLIRIEDNVSMLYTRDALELFGYKKGNFQSGSWHIKGTTEHVWFPKLYTNMTKDGVEWVNTLENDSKTIKMQKKVNGEFVECDDILERAIVFAHYKNLLGFVVYRFMGVFEPEESSINRLKFINGKAPVTNKINTYKLVQTEIDLSKYHMK